MPDPDALEAAVRDHYAAAAKAAPRCCGGSVLDPSEVDVFGASRYEKGDLGRGEAGPLRPRGWRLRVVVDRPLATAP